MSDEFVEGIDEAGVATPTLDRPPANIMNSEMMKQVNSTLLDLRHHRERKVLVIRGAGPAFFGGVEIADHARDRVGRMYLHDLIALRDAPEGIERTLEGGSPPWHDA